MKSSRVHPQGTGALLFAVVGAKLSEGLNFADDLARAVVIVGLPFANLSSPELRERMNYVRRQNEQRVTPKPAGAKDAGTELYENMCMNAVNQSIGKGKSLHLDASLRLMDVCRVIPCGLFMQVAPSGTVAIGRLSCSSTAGILPRGFARGSRSGLKNTRPWQRRSGRP